MFKTAAVRLSKVGASDGHPAPAPTTGAARPIDETAVPPTVGGRAADAMSDIREG
jgi:hypothetical protein